MNQIDAFIEKLPQHKATLLHFLMGVVFECDKKLTARIAYGLPFIYGKKGICYFNVKPNGIDVGFMYGIRLPHRAEFIATDRKQVRSLFFTWEEDVNVALLKAVVKDALAFDLIKK